MALDLAANGTAAGWVFPWETPPLTREWFILMGCAGGCVCTAALAAGLTMGMLSIEPFSLHLTEATDLADCATPELRRRLALEKRWSARILPLVTRHHWLLVTLLLMNAAANEALPIFLDRLVPSWLSVLLSVTIVLVFGEILPSALFTGPSQLRYASGLSPLVSLFMFALAPIAWPISKLLDFALGHSQVESFQRAELKALIRMHGSSQDHQEHEDEQLDHRVDLGQTATNILQLGGLSTDEITIMQGVLDVSIVSCGDAMLPIERADMLHVVRPAACYCLLLAGCACCWLRLRCVCMRLHAYACVCLRMLAYACVCLRMLSYACVCLARAAARALAATPADVQANTQDAVLDANTMAWILSTGRSRIPVFAGERSRGSSTSTSTAGGGSGGGKHTLLGQRPFEVLGIRIPALLLFLTE